MKFHIMTLFPEIFEPILHSSILGRGLSQNLFEVELINIRDFSGNKHNRVDDYTYGGGAGMLMAAPPVYDAYQSIRASIAFGETVRTIYLTPQGTPFVQRKAEELSTIDHVILLCGHYEGIDERVLSMIVTDYCSIGDYVLTGGELPAMIVLDSVARLLPGVLSNEDSARFESFHDNLLEYPQYTRPEDFMGQKVPEVLLSGHHAKIEKWRREQSIQRTLDRRPDLLRNASLSKKEKIFLDELQKNTCNTEN